VVESLVVNGNMTFDSIDIKEHIVNFNIKMYSDQFMWRPKLDSLSFLPIDVKERNWMEREFEES
jgi:hypothetical protein